MWTICVIWLFVSLFVVMFGAARDLELNGHGNEQLVAPRYLGLVGGAWVLFGILPVLVVVGLAKVLFS